VLAWMQFSVFSHRWDIRYVCISFAGFAGWGYRGGPIHLLLEKLGPDGYETWASQTRDAVRERELIIEENLQEDRRYVKVTNLEIKIDCLTAEIKELKDLFFNKEICL
jgi:hypothetical protein